MKKLLGDFVKVEQLKGDNGKVKNQFIITTTKGKVFQSYDTIICAKIDRHIFLDHDSWDYSKTTAKYRNKFLNENTQETRKKIDSGLYTLIDLNEE